MNKLFIKLNILSYLILTISCQTKKTKTKTIKNEPFCEFNKISNKKIKYDDNTVTFIFVGHPDDWQLFIGKQSFDYIRNKKKLVFVYISTGDSGRDQSYWELRETAATRSFQVLLGDEKVRKYELILINQRLKSHNKIE